MNSASVIRIEKGVDRGASALFGLACGYAAYGWFSAQAQQPLLVIETAAACVLAYLLSLRVLSTVQPEPRKLPVQVFDVREVEPMEPPKPLTEADASIAAEPEPLLLEDELPEPQADSRVVRLFDPAAMPPAREPDLAAERRPDEQPSAAQSADAAQALHDALAELRRSIR